MRIVVLGDADDVRGFALVGVHGQVCRDAREAEAHLARIPTQATEVGLVLISSSVARLATRTVERLREREGGPTVIVLPDTANGDSTNPDPNARGAT
jgi:vacuolar-type H+-ATPase subunit F/Vma7